MAFLMVAPPQGDAFRYELSHGNHRIGRSSRNDLVLDDLAVTRQQHARIEQRLDGHFIVHVGGRNRTEVNGRPVLAPTQLQQGDAIHIGETRLVYDAPLVEISRDPLPETSQATIVSFGARETLKSVPAWDNEKALQVVLEANDELVLHHELPEFFEAILNLASRVVPFERGLVLTLEGDHLVQQVIRAPGHMPGDSMPISNTIVQRAVDEGQSILVDDALVHRELKIVDSIDRNQIRSVMCVPLMTDREIMGALYVDSRRKARAFNEHSLYWMTQLANVAAVKIENKRLLDEAFQARLLMEELRRAAEIQAHLLPSGAPTLPGYLLAGTSDPCHAVGGDYFDFIELSDGRIAIALGDVAGRGLSAALLMCSLQAGFVALAEEDPEPAKLLARLNRALSQRLPSNRFVTFFLGVLNPKTHVLTYVNAGQNCPCVVRGDGTAVELARGGLPLGIMNDATWKAMDFALEPDDVLCCYSDGVTDTLNAAGDDFGERRLVASVAESRREEPEGILDAVQQALADHVGDLPSEDDVTLVVLKRVS